VSVYRKIMRAVAEKKRVKRKSTLSKLKAAVTLNGITGSVKAFTAFRRLEKENGWSTSANCSLNEAREGTNIIWESCQADLTIYATRDGHALSVRNTLEIELLRYLQSDRSKAPRKTADGKERARPVSAFEHRTPAPKKEESLRCSGEGEGLQPPNGGLPGPDPYPGKWQDRFTVKFTWDARSISKKMNQTEGMLLIIPHGPDGTLYCQSALRIRTVIVYSGKDSKEMVQENLRRIIDEIEEIHQHGLRYTAATDTFLNQVKPKGEKAPLESGDRDVQLDMVLPADMAAHIGLMGQGGIRDSDEQFCTHCGCLKSDRHRPLCLVRVEAEATVEELAAAHCMLTDDFLAMNTGRDPSGMSPEAELTERVLSHNTLPLPRGRNQPSESDALAAPDPALQAPGAPMPPAAANQAQSASLMQFDSACGPAPRKRRRRAAASSIPAEVATVPLQQPAAPVEVESYTKEDKIDLNSEIGSDETCLRGDQNATGSTKVHAGSIVRVVSTYKVDRPSSFLSGLLSLDQHR
jgi:hypothetical protein